MPHERTNPIEHRRAQDDGNSAEQAGHSANEVLARAHGNGPFHERGACRTPSRPFCSKLRKDAPPRTCRLAVWFSRRGSLPKLRLRNRCSELVRNHPTARLYTRSSLALALLASPGSILVDEALDRCRRVAKNSSLALILHVVMNRSDNGQNCAAKKNKSYHHTEFFH